VCDDSSLVDNVGKLTPVGLIITSTGANTCRLPGELTKLLQMPLEIHTFRARFLQRPALNKYLIDEALRVYGSHVLDKCLGASRELISRLNQLLVGMKIGIHLGPLIFLIMVDMCSKASSKNS
jgi:hypothetical protein